MPQLTFKQLQTLSTCPVFSGLSLSELESLLQDRVELGHFQRDQVIYSPTHFEEMLGVLLEGSAVAVKPGGVVLNRFGEGSCFGVATLFSPHKTYVTTVRAQSSCTIAFVSEEQMRNLFRENETIAINYISFLSSRIHFLNSKIDKFTAVSAEDKLALWLLDQMEISGSVIEMCGSYAQLADMLNLGRASLYRAFDQLEAEGILKKEKKRIQILVPEKLRPQTN